MGFSPFEEFRGSKAQRLAAKSEGTQPLACLRPSKTGAKILVQSRVLIMNSEL
jgi:hypothetical protein